MNQEPITSLKGIGEKTGALFQKLGIETVDDLLHDYPRGYDSYDLPTPIRSLRSSLKDGIGASIQTDRIDACLSQGPEWSHAVDVVSYAVSARDASDGKTFCFSRKGREKEKSS